MIKPQNLSPMILSERVNKSYTRFWYILAVLTSSPNPVFMGVSSYFLVSIIAGFVTTRRFFPQVRLLISMIGRSVPVSSCLMLDEAGVGCKTQSSH